MNKFIKIIIFCALLVLISGAIYFIYKLLNKNNSNIIKTYGNIEIRQVDLAFQVDGIINKINVEEGDVVKEGDILATLDDKDYVANYEKALYQIDSSLAQSKEDYDKYKRNLPLCSDNTISKQECDTYLNKKNLSNATYNQNKANAKLQKNRLDYTKLFAPQDGIITTRVQEKGAWVSANKPVFVLSLNKPIWVRTYIKETDLGNIKYGQKARVLTDTIDYKTKEKKSYLGTVGYISPVAEFTPKTVQTQDLRADLVYRIRVYIDETDPYIRQGMPVTVEIEK